MSIQINKDGSALLVSDLDPAVTQSVPPGAVSAREAAISSFFATNPPNDGGAPKKLAAASKIAAACGVTLADLKLLFGL